MNGLIVQTADKSMSGQSTGAIQTRLESPQERKDREALNMASWFYVSTAAADWSLTAACAKVLCFDKTQTGLFINGVERESVAFPLALAIDAAILYGTRELIAPDHPKFARGLLYVLGGARAFVVVAKVRDLRDHARRTLP